MMLNKLLAKTNYQRNGLSIAWVTLLMMIVQLTQAAPCPLGSEGDHQFRSSDLNKCVWGSNHDHKKPTPSSSAVGYNIYCPGRMTQAQANSAGKSLVNGFPFREKNPASTPRRPNLIQRQYTAIKAKPMWKSTPHVFHYGCNIGGRSGVATHIQVVVRGTNFNINYAKLPREIANSCRAVNQNGAITREGRIDVEYKCSLIDKNNLYYAREAAVLLAQKNFLPQAKRMGSKICMLLSTDMKGEKLPMKLELNHDGLPTFDHTIASNALVVRMQTKPNNKNCMNDTYQEIR